MIRISCRFQSDSDASIAIISQTRGSGLLDCPVCDIEDIVGASRGVPHHRRLSSPPPALPVSGSCHFLVRDDTNLLGVYER